MQIPNGLVGTAVTFLLVFRANTAYERWWEGRQSFREVVNHTRDLARQIEAYMTDYYLAEKCFRWSIAWVVMLKQHLREETWVDELRGLLSDEGINYLASCHNKPMGACHRLAEIIHEAVCSRALLPDLLPSVDLNVTDIVNTIGECEMCGSQLPVVISGNKQSKNSTWSAKVVFCFRLVLTVIRMFVRLKPACST
jgi:predicted membrane chloride channel (bestrophin family)